ncbi:MAG TPA: twin-arginine translocation signal domain-containing protein [Candidatus Hydrogenedentes bacterium]|nr:twin-arginine translocation signal domain-containing protein [Candidatus Hydrogenedentota bacterium]
MHECCSGYHVDLSRRTFLQAVGTATAGATLGAKLAAAQQTGGAPVQPRQKGEARIRAAFLYPPTEKLRQEGYYSWPGASFDAEGRQRTHTQQVESIARELGMRVDIDAVPLDEEASVSAFIANVKQEPPDGLLLTAFKKSHWRHVTRIIDETGVPSIAVATVGVLLVDHIRPMHRKPGVYMISSSDDFDAVKDGMRMVRASRAMRESLLIDIRGEDTSEALEPHLKTRIRTIPHERFYSEYASTELTPEVKRLADNYRRHAKESVEPTQDDIRDAARCYFALKRVIEAEGADAMMMDCLPGLRHPRKHVPPCMAFMSLRDEGIPAGCQSDINATLSLMLVQSLFGLPGFQQNAAMDTARNLYFGAHCTCPSRMLGPNSPQRPYILRSHAEAGWGCVPRVLFEKGQKVTLLQYLTGEKPEVLLYTGDVVDCPAMPPAGGCRTNIAMTINEVADVCDVKGMHQVIFCGDHGRSVRAFCQLYNIPVVS